MSFALPSVKVKPEMDKFESPVGHFGVPDVMTTGLSSIKTSLAAPHAVMKCELNYKKNQDSMNMAILRNTQGLHAPLKIAMELKAMKKVGRLPFLPSSNALLDSLTGKDILIGSEDIFGQPEFSELAGQPHAFIERSLGLI